MTLIGAEGEKAVPLQSKEQVAAAILDRVEQLLATPIPPVRSARDATADATGIELRAHLEFFEELGVDGVRADPAWARRMRADAPSARRNHDGRAVGRYRRAARDPRAAPCVAG